MVHGEYLYIQGPDIPQLNEFDSGHLLPKYGQYITRRHATIAGTDLQRASDCGKFVGK
jgi:hypothetical protein